MNCKAQRRFRTRMFCFFLPLSLVFSRAFAVGWDDVPGILQSIVPPQFPDREFLITSYGAVGDGTTDCTNSFKSAIDACAEAGGGKVVVPSGTFSSGAITLKSNVNLHLKQGSVIKFSTDFKKFLPVVLTRFESVEVMNYSPLIYALDAQNIAVTGSGTLDGQGSAWWDWKQKQKSDRDKLFKQAEDNVEVAQRIYGDGKYLRPNFFQPYRCKNILVDGVTFKDSPMWFLNPVLCENVSILNTSVEGQGANNDGCDPECSKNVLIRGCTFNNGDDCIAIKAGRNADGRRVNIPCQNVIIQKCRMKDGHGGITVGSETSGSIRNIFAEDDTLSSANLDHAIRFKTNAVRGGTLENFYYRNIVVDKVAKEAIIVDFDYEEGNNGNFLPKMKNLVIENFKCQSAKAAMKLIGYSNSKITDVTLKNCTFANMSSKTNTLTNVDNLKMMNVKINGEDVSNTSIDKKDVIRNSYNFRIQPTLAGNYSAVNVWYTLPTSGNAVIQLFDLSGSLIETKQSGFLGDGEHTMQLQLPALSAGWYFCRISSGEFTETAQFSLNTMTGSSAGLLE